MSNVDVMRLVFSNKINVVIALSISSSFFVIFNILDEHLFFSPVVAFYVSPDAYTNFVLSTAIITLLGIVISMHSYSFSAVGASLKEKSALLSGSFVAIATGACGCSSLGFAIISAFGGTGIAATSFLTTYQSPLRIASLAVLIYAYYSVRKIIIRNCTVRKN
ncbi:MAG: hypothetical protein QXU32_08095 [Nitrososphaerales archaeon]